METEYTKHEDKLVETTTSTNEATFTYEEITTNIASLEKLITKTQEERDTQIQAMQETLDKWMARKSEADRLGVEPETPVVQEEA